MSLSRPLYDTLYRSIVKTFTEAGGYGLLDSFGSNNASAAYSLRSLRDGYIGPAIRVRRSGDNAERDFSHGQIDNGVLTNWVNQLSAFDPEVATDLTDQALAAHSLRDLTGLSRPVVRLRRASDNAESDFTAADLVGSVEGAELVTNGDFATGDLTGWSAGSGWSYVGGAASLDGTQTSNTILSQDDLFDGDGGNVRGIFKMTFDVTCSDYSELDFLRTGTLVSLSALGITTDGTYTLIFDSTDASTTPYQFGFFSVGNNGVTATIDNVSLKRYTPSSAEDWIISNSLSNPVTGLICRQNTDNAHVTTWYDQSASNEQVYPNSGGVIDASEWTGQTAGNQIVLDKSGGYMSSNHIVGIDTYLEDGKTYKVSFNYVNTGNSADWYTGFPGGQLVALPAGSGEFEFILTRNGSGGYLRFQTNGSFAEPVTLTITGPISITEIGNVATQTTSNNQPKLIKAGVTNTVDNKPAILFNDDESSVRTWLDLSYFPAGGSLDSYYVVKPADSVYLFPNGTSYYGPVYQNSGGTTVHVGFANPNFKFYVNGRYIELTSRQKYYQAISPNQHHLAVHQDHKGDGTATNFGIYSTGPATVYNFSGSAQEILVYDTSQLANRTKIERNINRYYNLWYEENTKLIGDTTSPTAAAAYSLRSLDGDATANVVRLRRVSDNEERDFTAADLVGSVEGGELVDNSNWTTTGSSTHWTINGSLLSIDGTQTSQAVIRQDGIIEAKQYVLSFDVTCNDYSDLWIQYLGSSASRFYANELGITTDGSYSLLLDLRGRDNPMFRFYVKQSGTQATLDNVSLKEYTPSVAEEWSWVPTWRVYTRQVYDTAFVTTLYDQAASNEQVFDDPTITGSWTEIGDVVTTSGVIEFTNVSVSSRADSDGAEIPAGTYRIEVDYEDVTQADRFSVGVVNETPLVISSTGSGTQSVVATFDVTRKVSVRGANAISGQSGKITGIRFIDIGNSATQSTSTAQPKLITAGVTELDNGKPAMVFDGTDDYLAVSSTMFDGSSPTSVFNVMRNDLSPGRYLLDGHEAASRFLAYNNGGLLSMGASPTISSDTGYFTTSVPVLTSFVQDAAYASEIFKDGVSAGAGTSAATPAATLLRIGCRYNINDFCDTAVQEIIIYASDQTFNREAIEDNINDYYSIYGSEVYDGFVTVWYDQSKNSNHATQSTFTNQPKIVSSGVLLTENGKPTLSFDGTDDSLDIATSPLTVMNNLMVTMVTKLSGGNNENGVALSEQPQRIYVPYTTGGDMGFGYDDSATKLVDGSITTDQQLLTLSVDATTARGFKNGAAFSTTPTATADTGAVLNTTETTPKIGSLGTAQNWGGKFQEIIIYASDQSANRFKLESNINNYYSIYYDSNSPLIGGKNAPTSTAAYSLRALDGYTDQTNVVRLRRASDNAEKDFSAGELIGSSTGAELVTNGGFATDSDWTKGTGWSITGGQVVCDGTQVTLSFLDQDGIISSDADVYYKITFTIVACSDFAGAGTRIGNGSLKQFGNQWQILSTGTYSAIFKTAGTNTDFRFYALAGVTLTLDDVSCVEYTPTTAELWALNDRSLAARQFGESAYATTWYDQSGSGNNATQSTAAAQPLLIRAGVTELDNGKPAMVFDGVDDVLTPAGGSVSTVEPFAIFTIVSENPSALPVLNNGIFSIPTSNLSHSVSSFFNNQSNYKPFTLTMAGSSDTFRVDQNISRDANQHLIRYLYNGSGLSATNFDLNLDGSTYSATSAGTVFGPVRNTYDIGRGHANYAGNYFDGKMQEFIVYTSDQSANRRNIETNINNHYNIY